MQDWQSRAVDEYFQLVTRINALKKMLKDWEEGNLTYKPSNPRNLSEEQLEAMEKYRDVLWERLRYVLNVTRPTV